MSLVSLSLGVCVRSFVRESSPSVRYLYARYASPAN